MFFNLFLLNCVMKLSNYCCVLVYILQTLALLMVRRCQIHHMIQVWILMTIRTWLMLRMIMIRMRPMQQRDMLLLIMVHRCCLLLAVVDLRPDIGWSWPTNSVH